MRKVDNNIIKKILKEEVNLLKFRRNIDYISDILWEIMANYDVAPTQSGEKLELEEYKSDVINILQDVLYDYYIFDETSKEGYDFLYDFFGQRVEDYWNNWEPWENEYENIVETINNGRRILRENVDGIDQFIGYIVEYNPKFKPFSDKLREFIEKSGCKKIEFAGFRYPASGAALHDGVLINQNMLNQGLPMLLFVIFHEIAHQFQYKKYGAEAMYKVYSDEMDVNEAAKLMHNIELVADEFATRKVREFIKLGAIDSKFISPQVYKNVPMQRLVGMIEGFRKTLSEKFPEGNVSPEKLSEAFYNMIKSKGVFGLGFFGL